MMNSTYLTRAFRVLILEGGHASHLTAAVIIAVQDALAKCFAILGHTGIQVVIVGGVLK